MKHFIMSIFFVIAGCTSIQFDNIEYSRYSDIQIVAKRLHANCDKPEEAAQLVVLIAAQTDLAVNYSKYKVNNENIYNAALKLQKITEGARDQYLKGVPSVAYCQTKAEIISMGAESIITGLIKEPTK